MTVIAYIVIILGILTLIQLVRVFEITGKLKGNNQTEVSDAENRFHGASFLVFMVAYFAFFIYIVVKYGPHLLPEAASEHGANIDMVLNLNFAIIITAFVITHILLFFFASKYAGSKHRKAEYVTHNNKLELIWTTVPAVVLAVIVIYGLSAWIDITDEPSEEAIKVELYSKQFGWIARYPGEDNELGKANYLFLNGTNPLGLITPATIETRITELEADIVKLEKAIEEAPEDGLKEKELTEDLDWKVRQLRKIKTYQKKNEVNPYTAGSDDKVAMAGEFHVPVNQEISFSFRSQDVVHSAYMPHFRAQMNSVPGTVTTFKFTPTITTEEMRKKTSNPDFNYLLLCNKICGAAHYNMQMNIIVESEEDYNKWLAEQKSFEENTTAEVPTASNDKLAQK
tara:strand:- start:21160 stop:22353 length:1194 start_codon:yes stop_codon:yes gene_type:complete